MALSTYDEDHDGRCDANTCKGLLMLLSRGFFPEMREMARMIRRNLEAIGIELRIETVPASDAFDDISDPSARVPLALFPSWGKDFLNASTFIGPLFASEGIRAANVLARRRVIRAAPTMGI